MDDKKGRVEEKKMEDGEKGEEKDERKEGGKKGEEKVGPQNPPFFWSRGEGGYVAHPPGGSAGLGEYPLPPSPRPLIYYMGT